MKHLLREGTAEAESILRCFTRNNLQHPTYKALSELGKACRTIFLCRYINTERVARHWEDMLRVAGSLKLSTITAPELIRSLLKSDRPSGLTKAIGDLGHTAKTIHLLRYLDDESFRRRILVQLNRGEGRHVVARRICHGQRGEIRKRYRDGREEQLTALGLVTNAVVLWNTIYMETALEQLRTEGFEVRAEDVARLSPLQVSHINMLGRYAFLLAEAVANGGMRPLRNLGDDI